MTKFYSKKVNKNKTLQIEPREEEGEQERRERESERERDFPKRRTQYTLVSLASTQLVRGDLLLSEGKYVLMVL